MRCFNWRVALMAILIPLLTAGRALAAPATFDDLEAYGPVDAAMAEPLSLLLNETYLGVLDHAPTTGITGWLGRERTRTQDNIGRARRAMRMAGTPAITDRRMLAGVRHFVTAYADEQMRLARLFSRTPSEIEAYPGERVGWELPDKTLALTFDDGPLPATTPGVLRALRAHNVPATFFVLGQKVAANGARIDYKGYEVGSHTWSHLMIPEAGPGALQQEIARTRKAIAAAGIPATKWFRAPYGARRPGDLKIIAAEGLQSVVWNIDSQDWQEPMQHARDRIANRIVALSLLRRRGIVLCHDTVPATGMMIEGLITRLTRLGFHFQRL